MPDVTRDNPFLSGEQYKDRYIRDRYALFSSETLPTRSDDLVLQSPFLYRECEPASSLSSILRTVFSYCRLEPENPYLFHTSAPSARGMNSNGLLVRLLNRDGSELLLNYLFRRERYQIVWSRPVLPRDKEIIHIEPSEIWISAMTDLGQIGRKYGSFGYTLSLLDAGHQIEHIQQFAIRHGLSREMMLLPGDHATGGAPLFVGHADPTPCFIPIFSWHLLHLTDFTLQRTRETVRVKKSITHQYDGHDPSGWVREHANAIRTSEPIRISETPADDLFVEECRLRTSAQSFQGWSFFPYPFSEEEMREQDDLIERALKATHPALEIHLLRRLTDHASHSFQTQYDVFRTTTRERRPFEMTMAQIIHDTHDFLNADLASLAAWTALAVDAPVTDRDIVAILTESARILHRLSLLLTRYRLASRPLKNINEDFFEHTLTNGQSLATYLLLAGRSMTDHLFCPLA